MRIDELLATPIRGNHFQDQSLLDALDGFIADDTNAMADRAKAVRRFYEVMGFGVAEGSDAEVVGYFLAEEEENAMEDGRHTASPDTPLDHGDGSYYAYESEPLDLPEGPEELYI